MTVHSQKTRVPAVWPAIAQMGQLALEVGSPEGARKASCSGDMAPRASVTRSLYNRHPA